PAPVKEDEPLWSDEFLQGPPAREPAALLEGRGVGGLDVDQVGVTHLGIAVPLEHGVDGLGKLGAAALVDAARVDPDISIAVATRLGAAVAHLGEAFLPADRDAVAPAGFPHVFEEDLVVGPRVRENGVVWRLLADESLELQRGGIEKAHDC